ncbi:hypothetical protein ES703_73144 [subsurface metagenome]
MIGEQTNQAKAPAAIALTGSKIIIGIPNVVLRIAVV